MIVAPPDALDPVATTPPGARTNQAEAEQTLLGCMIRGLAPAVPSLFYATQHRAIAVWVARKQAARLPHDHEATLRAFPEHEATVNRAWGFSSPEGIDANAYLREVRGFRDQRHELKRLQQRAQDVVKGDVKPEEDEFRLELRPAASMEEASTSWLWYPYLPRGELVVLAGMPGTGKSNLSRWLAAQVSTGCNLAARTETDEDWLEEPHPERVDFVCAEDHPAKVVVPRLRIQGADLDMVRIVTHPKDIPITSLHLEGLERAWEQDGPPGLLVLDPASSMIPTGVDANAQSDVKQSVTGPLSRLAARWNVCVLLVTHVAKKSPAGGAHILTWIHGSIEWSAGARAALVALRHQHDQDDKVVRVFTAKQNLGPEGPAFSYEIQGRGRHCEVVWRGLTQDTPAKLTTRVREDAPSKVEAAVDWLHSYLTEHGPTSPADVRLEGMRQGHSRWSLDEAKVTVKSTGRGRDWRWSIPDGDEGDDPTP